MNLKYFWQGNPKSQNWHCTVSTRQNCTVDFQHLHVYYILMNICYMYIYIGGCVGLFIWPPLSNGETIHEIGETISKNLENISTQTGDTTFKTLNNYSRSLEALWVSPEETNAKSSQKPFVTISETTQELFRSSNFRCPRKNIRNIQEESQESRSASRFGTTIRVRTIISWTPPVFLTRMFTKNRLCNKFVKILQNEMLRNEPFSFFDLGNDMNKLTLTIHK